MHQVIARKWRPQRFEDLVGQEAIARTLQNALRYRRWHHAYIFAGPRGVGKTTTARLFAKALNCVQGPTPEPCNECPPCREIVQGNALDVLEIDAASHTGVDNVRQVILDTLALGPARDRYRIFIIDECHQLSTSAFNALLKTLEEPPPHVLFLMATTELHKVPATILSRCQIFEFRLIPEGKIAERLRRIADAEGIAISDSALRRIARAGQGSLRDAQSLLEQAVSFAGPGEPISDEVVTAALGLIGTETLLLAAEAIADRDGARLLRLVQELSERGYDLRHFCRDLMAHFRNLLVAKVIGRDRELLPLSEGEMDQLLAQARRFHEEEIVRAFRALTELEQNLRYASEPRFSLEVGLLRLAHLERVRPLAQVIRSLEELERRLAHLTPSPPATEMATPPRAESMEDAPLRPQTPSSMESSDAAHTEVERLKEELRERGKMLILGALDKAKAIEIAGEALRVTFPPHLAVHRETLLDRTNKQVIEAVARQVIGRPLTLQVRVEEDRARTPSPDQRARAVVEADPIVKAFVKTFKGEIVEIVPPEKAMPEEP
ncbi:DNA polymerase III subunit tau [bacterium HR10]|uniref:DNA polymerase III subunit gamma/tau n=1 Tax=uncultured Acidobacteriota bacterium TaxID=171953 RepID=H5SPN5_9BACT|nr:DNA polymerase III subunit gamma/tau [uncultured Acidobacteriota bacterium]GBC82457.1 DNA polymerase III subunit tau [bacterium HR10]